MDYIVLAAGAAGTRATFSWGKMALVEAKADEIKPYHQKVVGPGPSDNTYFVATVFDRGRVTNLLDAFTKERQQKQDARLEQTRREQAALLERQRRERARLEAEAKRLEEQRLTEAFISDIKLMDEGALLDDTQWPAKRVQSHVLQLLEERNNELLSEVWGNASRRYAALTSKAEPLASPVCTSFYITRSVHRVTKLFVMCVQRWCDETEGQQHLNLVRGVDLLNAVGKLSHMINSADIPDSHRPKVPSIGELFKFERARKRGFTKPTYTSNPIDLVLQFLDRKSYLNLCATSQSFLFAFAFYPPNRDLATTLGEATPRNWLRRAQLALDLPTRSWKGLGSLEALVDDEPRNRAAALRSSLAEVLAAPTKGAQATVAWGAAQHATFELAGAIRLNFCEDLRVVRSHVDRDADLQYSSIARSLGKNPIRTRQLQLAFKDLTKVKGSLIGEACILMVSLEGTMNNLMVADVPFASQLIACGHLTWKDALFPGPSQLASIPFASSKAAKPQSVMNKQATLLTGGQVRYDRTPKHLANYEAYKVYMSQKNKEATKERYEKEKKLMNPAVQEALFGDYMGAEYALHEQFFGTLFRGVYDCDGGLQALCAALVTAEFLCATYGVTAELKAYVDAAIDQEWSDFVVQDGDL